MVPMLIYLMTPAVLLSCAFVACDLTEDTPKIEIFPLEQTVTSGSTTAFICTVTGNSKFQIRWLRHGENLHYHPQNGSLYGSPRASYKYIPKYEKIDMINFSALKIISAEPGTFECIVGNGTEEELVRVTAQLKTIDSPPKIEIFPRHQTVKSGDIAVFVCMLTNKSNLRIKWTRINGSETQDRSRYKSLYGSHDRNFGKIPIFETINMTNGSMLRIHALGPETFDCVVEKGADESGRATAHLNTISNVSPRSGFPQISPQSTDIQRVTKGYRILLPCLVMADPKPTIRWLKDKLPLNMSIPRYFLFEEQFLQISYAEEEDNGIYECLANNSVGTALSTKIELLVSDRLQPPYFTINPENTYRPMPGSSLNITCLANGSPQPSVKWIEDSEVISPSRDGLNVLHLTDIQGSHNFTCVASSEVADTEATVQVITITHPTAPTNLTVSRVTTNCINLSWSYDNPFEVNLYTIHYKASDEKNFKVRYAPGWLDGLYDDFCDLRRGTEYEIYFTAKNSVGEGPRSSSVFFTTKRY